MSNNLGLASRNWSEEELKVYLGREESLQLEFKSGRLLQKQREEIAEDLSKVVSAFANSEGGVLILGVDEKKEGKRRIAAAFDGVDAGIWSNHQLQQILESNVHPGLPGLRVHSVPLAGSQRVVIVVEVPQGRTAYQAKDCRYYGRSEFESKALRDHEVRLRMARGGAPYAIVTSIIQFRRSAKSVLEAGIKEYQEHLRAIYENAKKEGIDLASPNASISPEVMATLRAYGADHPNHTDLDVFNNRYRYSEYEVVFCLNNAGEKTIRDFETQITATATNDCGVSGVGDVQPTGGFTDADDITKYRRAELRRTLANCLAKNAPQKVWPRGECSLGSLLILVPESGKTIPGDVKIEWSVFLDDILPITGEFNPIADIQDPDGANTRSV